MIPETKTAGQLAFELFVEGKDYIYPVRWDDLPSDEKEEFEVAANSFNRLPPLDDRERATLEGCLDYAKKPYGDVGHNLKMLVAKLAYGRVEND